MPPTDAPTNSRPQCSALARLCAAAGYLVSPLDLAIARFDQGHHSAQILRDIPTRLWNTKAPTEVRAIVGLG